MKQLDDTPKDVLAHAAKVHEAKKKEMHPSQKYVSLLNSHYPNSLYAQHSSLPPSFGQFDHTHLTRFHLLNHSFAFLHFLLVLVLGAHAAILERWVLTHLFALFGVRDFAGGGGADGADDDNRQKHVEKHSLQGKHGKTHGIC